MMLINSFQPGTHMSVWLYSPSSTCSASQQKTARDAAARIEDPSRGSVGLLLRGGGCDLRDRGRDNKRAGSIVHAGGSRSCSPSTEPTSSVLDQTTRATLIAGARVIAAGRLGDTAFLPKCCFRG